CEIVLIRNQQRIGQTGLAGRDHAYIAGGQQGADGRDAPVRHDDLAAADVEDRVVSVQIRGGRMKFVAQAEVQRQGRGDLELFRDEKVVAPAHLAVDEIREGARGRCRSAQQEILVRLARVAVGESDITEQVAGRRAVCIKDTGGLEAGFYSVA